MASIVDLVSQLQLHTGKENHEQALELADSILKRNPDNAGALESRVVALIKLDKISQALKVFEKHSSLKSKMATAYAYTLYRLDMHAELCQYVQTLQSTPSRGVLHSLAQSEYKHESLSGVVDIYNKLAKSTDPLGSEAVDIQVNLGAVRAVEGFQGVDDDNSTSFSKIESDNDASYDQLFNAATYYISQKDWQRSLDLLQRAKLVCQQTPMSDDEKAEELAPILVQAAFVLSKKGESAQASATLNEVLDSKLSAKGLIRFVAVNNSIALNDQGTSSNPNLTLKDLMRAENAEVAERAIGIQARPLTRNRLLVEREIGKDTRSQAADLAQKYPSTVSAQALAWMQTVAGEKASTLRRNMQALLTSSSVELKDSARLALSLAVAQLFIDDNENYDAAANVLNSAFKTINDDNLKYLPGFVSTLVAIYALQHRQSQASDIVKSAVQLWSQNNDTSLSSIYGALQVLAESGNDVQQLMSQVGQQDDDESSQMTPSLVASRLSANLPVSPAQQALLPSVDSLINGIDTEDLESSGLLHNVLKRSNPSSASGRTSSVKRQKRKGKLPKAYDANATPDPERWLPKRDRSTYKPTRKEKKNAKSTQGGASDNTTLENLASTKQNTVKTHTTARSKKGRK